MARRVLLFSPWIRLWHWTHLAFLVVLVLSGLSLHFADPRVGALDFNLAQRVHNIFGVALSANYLFFLVANVVTGNWRCYLPGGPGYAGRAARQLRYYLWDIFLGRPAPFPATSETPFNPLQRAVYLLVMYGLMPLLVGTGFLYLWPELAPDRLFGVDGLLPVALVHYVVGYLIVLFLCVHVYLCTCGRTVGSHFRAMLTGWMEE